MKHKLTLLTLLFISILGSAPAYAQKQLSDTDRQRWLSELRTYKHEYLTKELSLTKEQQRDFFPLYDKMEDEVERINTETRQLETTASDKTDASELELENAARTVFEQKRAEGQVEMTYFEKFKEILSPRQLLRLKNAERKFTQQLVKHHRRMKGPKQN